MNWKNCNNYENLSFGETSTLKKSCVINDKTKFIEKLMSWNTG
jgi:hypothetical protein